MKVAVSQSNYIPWRGYFDLIASVDLFVLYDEVQYSKGSWRNRNQLKSKNGLQWLTLPVHASLSTPIDEVTVAPAKKHWRVTHRGILEQCLSPAPYFDDAVRLWDEGTRAETPFLSDLNIRLIDIVCEYLGIQTKRVHSRAFGARGSKTTRLVDLLLKVGATSYLSGPTAKDYIDDDIFRRHSIGLSYKSYVYSPYPQLWGDFIPTVSILDLIANVGSNSIAHCQSLAPDELIVADHGGRSV